MFVVCFMCVCLDGKVIVVWMNAWAWIIQCRFVHALAEIIKVLFVCVSVLTAWALPIRVNCMRACLSGWKYSSGFISDEMIKEHLPPPGDDTLILMCGPPPMINFACLPNLDKLNYSPAQRFAYWEPRPWWFAYREPCPWWFAYWEPCCQ